jgi:hypothetical protein
MASQPRPEPNIAKSGGSMSEVLVRPKVFRHSALNGKKSLEDFARGIEDKLCKSGDRDAIANRFCRVLMSNNERVAALMLCKWVEWRYGKAKEQLEHSGPGGTPIQIISYIPRPGSLNGNQEGHAPERGSAAQCSNVNCDHAEPRQDQAKKIPRPWSGPEPEPADWNKVPRFGPWRDCGDVLFRVVYQPVEPERPLRPSLRRFAPQA